MKIGAEVEVALPERLTIVATYTGRDYMTNTMAWVQLVDNDTSAKMLVPAAWVTEVKPPLPAEPVSQDAIVVIRHGGDGVMAFPYSHRAGMWINTAGQRLTWAEVCERDKDGDPVQVWPPAEPDDHE